MAKTVRVTRAQVNAARLKIKRSAVSGKYVSPSVHAIANAKRADSLNEADPSSRRTATQHG